MYKGKSTGVQVKLILFFLFFWKLIYIDQIDAKPYNQVLNNKESIFLCNFWKAKNVWSLLCFVIWTQYMFHLSYNYQISFIVTSPQRMCLGEWNSVAARLLTGTKKYEHFTPVLASLHWLPVRFRIEFKIVLIVFKILHAYLSELLHAHTPVRALRSSNQVLLDAPRARLKIKVTELFQW